MPFETAVLTNPRHRRGPVEVDSYIKPILNQHNPLREVDSLGSLRLTYYCIPIDAAVDSLDGDTIRIYRFGWSIDDAGFIYLLVTDNDKSKWKVYGIKELSNDMPALCSFFRRKELFSDNTMLLCYEILIRNFDDW